MDQTQSGATPCSICGTELVPENRFCPSCGAPNPGYTIAPGPEIKQAVAPDFPLAPSSPSQTAYAPPPSTSDWTPPPQQSNRRTWYILGGIFLVFVLICCCCALLVAVVASQDSALQEELEGTAQLLFALT